MLISLQQVVEKHEFVIICSATVVCTLLEGVNKFLTTFSIFLAIFYENMFSTNLVLFMGVNENFSYFLHSVSCSNTTGYRKYK